MFQAAFIKRASRLAPPAFGMAGIATAFAIVNNDYDDKNRLSTRLGSSNNNVALCDNNNKGGGSVVDMLNHIQEQVSSHVIMYTAMFVLFIYTMIGRSGDESLGWLSFPWRVCPDHTKSLPYFPSLILSHI